MIRFVFVFYNFRKCLACIFAIVFSETLGRLGILSDGKVSDKSPSFHDLSTVIVFELCCTRISPQLLSNQGINQ